MASPLHYLPAVSFWLLERWCQSIPPGLVEIHRWTFAVYACASASFSSSNCESGFWFLILTVCFLKYKYNHWCLFNAPKRLSDLSPFISFCSQKNTHNALDMGKLEYRRDSSVPQTNTFWIDQSLTYCYTDPRIWIRFINCRKMWSAFSISSILPSSYKALANLSQGVSIFSYFFSYEGELAVSYRKKKNGFKKDSLKRERPLEKW